MKNFPTSSNVIYVWWFLIKNIWLRFWYYHLTHLDLKYQIPGQDIREVPSSYSTTLQVHSAPRAHITTYGANAGTLSSGG